MLIFDEKIEDDEGRTSMIPQEQEYLSWQYCRDLNDIQKAVDTHDPEWQGLESLHQIISITFDPNHGCYVVFWICKEEMDD